MHSVHMKSMDWQMEHKTRIQSNLKQNLKDSIQELHNHQQDVKQLQADNT